MKDKNIKLIKYILVAMALLIFIGFVVAFIIAVLPASDEASGDVEVVGNIYKDPVDVEAQRILESMTLEEKVGQIFFVRPESLGGEDGTTEITEEGVNKLSEIPVGGIILFEQNIKNRDQVIKLIKDYQDHSKLPLFVGSDEEGGDVARVSDNEKMGVTHFPSMKEIGEKVDYEEAGLIGTTHGKELGELGFNVNFAPVADVIDESSNNEIGDRAFGSDAELVSEMVVSYVDALQFEGVSAVVKHFPGHGSAESDSHDGYSESNKSLKSFEKSDLTVFGNAINDGFGCDFVLMSHMTAPKLDSQEVPCSLSKVVVSDMLKDSYGFENVAITDSMEMGAIIKHYSPAEAAVAAVNAGEDMILLPEDLDEAYNGVLAEFVDGHIEESILDSRVYRILRVKIVRGLINVDSDN